MSEEIIHADKNVSISTSRIVIGATTYALRNITSVKMATTPAKQGCAILLIIFGVLILFSGLANASTQDRSSVIQLVIGGIVVGGLGVLWVRACKPSYNVLIASSSGEAKAMTSNDKAYIEQIVESINEAIIRYR